MTTWHLAIACGLALAAPNTHAAAPRATVHPKDTGVALANHGMGWVLHYYDNLPSVYGSRLAPSDTLDDWPGLTTIYLRIPWSYIEPQEGTFNWAVLDTPAQRWVAKGKRIALRITCSESWMRYATPEWVHKAGAKGHNFRPGKGVVADGPFWEPIYDDPVFLAKLDRFLAALAARYDGNPEVAFIDVGSLGVWGEGHMGSSTRLRVPAAVVHKHIDLHLKHFKKTLLAANDDFASQHGGDANLDYARQRGLALRDDSIIVQGGKRAYFHAKMAQAFWPTLPVILESAHYGYSKSRGLWKDGSLYLQAVEDYHASYASIHWWPDVFLDENRDLIRRMNLRLGYRLQLVEASWPTVLRAESAWTLTTTWRNAGVAPCLPGGFPCVTLKDDKGGIAGVFVDRGLDVRALPVGSPGKAEARASQAHFALPFGTASGTYGVYVSVGTRTGTPRIALPLPDGDGQRRYRVGTMRVTGDFTVEIGAIERKGDQWRLPCTWTIHRPLPATASPFGHFDRDGRIQFQGLCEADPAKEGIPKPDTVRLALVFDVPKTAHGHSFAVLVGIWDPEQPDNRNSRRMLPDRANPDRRVPVGTLAVAADGTPTFTPAKPSAQPQQ